MTLTLFFLSFLFFIFLLLFNFILILEKQTHRGEGEERGSNTM